MKVIIGLHGCDASTEFEYEINEAEFELLNKIAEKSKEVSTYGCMPVMTIEKVGE